MNGRVIGGHLLNGVVTIAPIGSVLLVQNGLRWRKLDVERVAEWSEIAGTQGNTVNAVGQAVAGAILPGVVSKPASAALAASLERTIRPPRTVSLKWVDGKESLIKMPDKLYTHFELILRECRTSPPEPTARAAHGAQPVPGAGIPAWTNHALALVSGLVKEHRNSSFITTDAPVLADHAEQLVKLTALSEKGLITAEEFADKKSKIISRM